MRLRAMEPEKWRKLSIALYPYGAGLAVFTANIKGWASADSSFSSCRLWVVREFQLPSCRTRARLAVIKDRGTWKKIHVYDFLWRHNTVYEQWAYICLRMLVGDIRFLFFKLPLPGTKEKLPQEGDNGFSNPAAAELPNENLCYYLTQAAFWVQRSPKTEQRVHLGWERAL